MEQVVVAVIIIFLLLFGVLTLANAMISSQANLAASWQEMNAQAQELSQTAITPVDIRILNSGSVIEATIRNSGSTKLADFDRWDVFVEYYDDNGDSVLAGTPTPAPGYHTARLSYNQDSTADDEWAREGIYVDELSEPTESYDPLILNPGELMKLHLNVAPHVGLGQSVRVSVSTQNGASASLMGTRNFPPTPVFYATGMRVANGGGEVITSDTLLMLDRDNEPDELSYTVVATPSHGGLTPDLGFTQANVDDNRLAYTHDGSGLPDSFAFTVSDGIDTVGPLSFPITIDAPPVLLNEHPSIVVPQGTASIAITSDQLLATDTDNSPNELIYTVIRGPSDGHLTPPIGATFTQAQIGTSAQDTTQLIYEHTGVGNADEFTFVISDGYDVIGPFTLNITFVAPPTEVPTEEPPTPTG